MVKNGIETLMLKYIILAVFCALPGCITFSNQGIPSNRLPDFLRGEEKGERIPLNFALLGQSEPRVYTICAGDLLGIYIRGLMPTDSAAIPPTVAGQANFTNIYYPPTGQTALPALGLPFEVSPEGNLNLPLIGPVPVAGLTLDQITTKISRALVEKKLSVEGKEYVYLTLIRSAVFRVMVIRDEVQNPSVTFQPKEAALMTRRGFAQVVDLPVNENDVLHALTISGGLPSFDAYNEVWILRRNDVHRALRQELAESAASGMCLDTEHLTKGQFATATRIPLWIRPGEFPSFSPDDVLLKDGDIVYIPSRGQEYFYTGGLLAGGVVPMPRDRDIDIIEAIAIANGSVGGAGGASGIQVIAGSGPGNIIPPSRATIVRKLPNKQQIMIRVDLTKAVRDPRHRVIVHPQDLVSLHYKPGELSANSFLNIINLNYVLPN